MKPATPHLQTLQEAVQFNDTEHNNNIKPRNVHTHPVQSGNKAMRIVHIAPFYASIIGGVKQALKNVV